MRDGGPGIARCRSPARAQAQGLLRPPPRARSPGSAKRAIRAKRARARHSPGLQARRYLRGGVRHLHRLSVFDLRRRVRSRADRRKRKIMILGGGPNRIGQGIEFDYCCVHAALQLREDGFETIMVNCNPETVSTDYDTSDRLYFEPLTLEDVLEVIAQGEARRRHRAVRRPDAAQAVARARGRRRADHRHVAGFHRHRRRPRALPAAGQEPRAQAARERHGAHRGPGRARWRATSGSRWWCVRRTCSAAAPWKWSSTRKTCATT